MARVLTYDIENMAALGWHWGLYDQTIVRVQKPQHLLSVAYKWLGERKTHVIALPDYKLYKTDPHNDRELVKAFWKVLDECDIAVGHNSRSFDTKMMQAAFMRHGLPPTSPFKQVDTKSEAKKYARFLSNKLDDLGDEFGIGNKLSHEGFDLWYKCDTGDMKAWRKMQKYNIQDVVLLEKIYLKMRPWMNNHPNLGVLDDRPKACNNCSSQHMTIHKKRVISNTGYKVQYQCQDCGAYKTGTKLHKFDEKLI